MRKILLATALAAALSPACAWAQAAVGSLSANQINQPNGVLGLNASSQAPYAQLPTGTGANQVAPGPTVAAITAFSTIAAAGTTQATATAVTAATQNVTSTAATVGVLLSTAIPNIRLIDTSSFAFLVYPQSGGTINAGAANASVSVAGSATCTLNGSAWTCG